MANWYVSSVAYAAITPWAATTAYTVGQIVRPTAAVAGKRIAYHCTTGGTSAGTEPTWGTTLSGTTTSGGAVFTAINSDTYGWTGAAGDLVTVTNASTSGFAAAGDKIFLSSDHSETTAAITGLISSISGVGWTTLTTSILSVNRSGSVPPVAADILSGASITLTSINIDPARPTYFEGLTLVASGGNITFNQTNYSSVYLKNCSLQLSGASSTYRIANGGFSEIIFDNTSVSFANAGQAFNFSTSLSLTWINTATPLLGTATTVLFLGGGTISLVACRGVDFSGYAGTFVSMTSSLFDMNLLLDSCKVSASATFLSGTPSGNGGSVELVNCWDGTNVRNERYTTGGSTVTERTITLTGGAADDVGAFSLKMVSGSTRIDKWVTPIASFWIDVENTAIGVSKTATVEIVSSAALNNDDIWLQLEYMGASGTPLATVANSQPATPLTAAVAVPTSTAAWNSSPATPVYQHLQITFTPQRAGRVRGRVMLGKASTTVYVDPNIVIA